MLKIWYLFVHHQGGGQIRIMYGTHPIIKMASQQKDAMADSVSIPMNICLRCDYDCKILVRQLPIFEYVENETRTFLHLGLSVWYRKQFPMAMFWNSSRFWARLYREGFIEISVKLGRSFIWECYYTCQVPHLVVAEGKCSFMKCMICIMICFVLLWCVIVSKLFIVMLTMTAGFITRVSRVANSSTYPIATFSK